MFNKVTIILTLVLVLGFLLAACAPTATAPAQAPTQAPAQAPTQAPTKAPTKTMPAAATEAPTTQAMVALQPVAEGLTSPLMLASPPDGTGRLFIVDQVGLIRIVTPDGKLLDEPFLDLRDRIVQLKEQYDERGLLGLAFHPNYAENGRFFVHYTAPLRKEGPNGWDNTIHISEFKVSKDDLNKADPASERILMQVDEPQFNHEGGTVAFGSDGYLYISLGDGGGANDVGLGHNPETGNGQDTSTVLGKILRIDVDSGDPYGIPADNPFAKGGGAPEVFAYGLRNPYRFSFDTGGDHKLFAADAGQDLYEEVDIVVKGGNYGWHIKEGTHCFDPNNPKQPPSDCPKTGKGGEPLSDPIVEYDHNLGHVVVGGYVYRGKALSGFEGKYIFGDWSTAFDKPDGTLLVATSPMSGDGMWSMQKISIAATPDGRLGHFVMGFGQDVGGEVYVLTKDITGPTGDTGRIFKLVPPSAGASVPPAATMAAPTPTVAAPTAAPAGKPTTAPAAGAEVKIANFAFDPPSLTVKVGTTVRWTNQDGTTHDVTSEAGDWAPEFLNQGQTFSHTFDKVGTFNYYCSIHPSMKGTIVVTE